MLLVFFETFWDFPFHQFKVTKITNIEEAYYVLDISVDSYSVGPL